MKLLVTGGAGFIGSHFVKFWLEKHKKDRIVTFDKLTYAGTMDNLRDVSGCLRHSFVKGDIGDSNKLSHTLKGIDTIINFAGETHVDRSLRDANPFIYTNVQGTFTLINSARKAKVRRFIHVSTDEVYGNVPNGQTDETTMLKPTSPYAASKASGDHLVLSAYLTYKFPVIVTRCTNNYGPRQHPEKFLPLFIINALEGRPLPLYGDGKNTRNWLHVLDHCEAIERVILYGVFGEIYNIASGAEHRNIDVARRILQLTGRTEKLLRHIDDRFGHDMRYAPDASKINKTLKWKPRRIFLDELSNLVKWYRDNKIWWKKILNFGDK